MSTQLRFATAGSVDDGKSTLVGRLLHDSKSVFADQLAAVERTSRSRGLEAADLALLTDGLRSEREQGITIDVAYRYFATPRRSFLLADCPGHVEYTRNTVTGCSTADAVVLLVDVRHGVVEQTRRHLAVAALLRVPHVVVAVNKIDLVDYAQDVFDGVVEQIRRVCADLHIPDLRVVPVSALRGDNVVSGSQHTPWYDGPALLELLETLEPATLRDEPLRMPVQLVIRPQGAAAPEFRDYRGYAGRIASGSLHVGDEVVVLPSEGRSTVTDIDLGERPLDSASAGDSVSVRLADDLDISRGDVLVAADAVPLSRREIPAVVCWLAPRPARRGERLLIKHGTRTAPALVASIATNLDLDTGDWRPTESLALNDIGQVGIRVAQPLPVESYEVSRSTGAFILIDPQTGATLAAGMAR